MGTWTTGPSRAGSVRLGRDFLAPGGRAERLEDSRIDAVLEEPDGAVHEHARKQARKKEIVWMRMRARSLRAIEGMPARATFACPRNTSAATRMVRERCFIATRPRQAEK
jgi:hypothetical protein